MARRGILDKKTQKVCLISTIRKHSSLTSVSKQLNRLNVSLFTPSLLFSKVAFFLSPGELQSMMSIVPPPLLSLSCARYAFRWDEDCALGASAKGSAMPTRSCLVLRLGIRTRTLRTCVNYYLMRHCGDALPVHLIPSAKHLVPPPSCDIACFFCSENCLARPGLSTNSLTSKTTRTMDYPTFLCRRDKHIDAYSICIGSSVPTEEVSKVPDKSNVLISGF